MLYMVIEHFNDGAASKIYDRFRERGRMMPEGLDYVASWISDDFKTCWQLMETDDREKFAQWTRHWDDLMKFDIIPVRTSDEVRALMSAHH